MLRTIAGIILGVIAWLVAVTALGYLVGHAWPALAAASKHPMTLTMPMLATRLGVSFLSSLISGLIAALIGGKRFHAPLGAGLILLAGFAYYHVTMIWHDYPVWYHLTFFASLPLLGLLGGRLVHTR
jgi:hypothetical protein